MADEFDKYKAAPSAIPDDEFAQYKAPSAAPVPGTQKPGFFGTLMNDAVNTVRTLRDISPFNTPETRQAAFRGMIEPNIEAGRQARDAFNAGSYGTAGVRALEAAMPFVGPLAAQTGREIESGDYAPAAAHALELFGPKAVHAVAGIPEVRGAVTGGIRGAIDATKGVPVNLNRYGVGVEFNVPKPLVTGAAGSGLGAAAGAPFGLHGPGAAVGGAVGTLAPIVKGAIQGAREGMQGFDRSSWPAPATEPFKPGFTLPRSPGAYDPLSESGGVGHVSE